MATQTATRAKATTPFVAQRYRALYRHNYEVKLFDELFTLPLARDPRVTHQWMRSSEKNVKYVVPLTGGTGVILKWLEVSTNKLLGRNPRSFIRLEPRAPTGICTNVLFTLLRLALERKTNTLEFADWNELAREIGVMPTNFYMFATWDAIRLWQQLSIQWPTVDLGPPISKAYCSAASKYYSLAGKNTGKLRIEGDHSLKIVLDNKWLDRCTQASSKPVRLPAPMQATPQNIVLSTWFHGSVRILNNPWFYCMSGNKHGLDITPWVPIESFVVASTWYNKLGGFMDYQREPFTIHKSGKSYKPSQYIQTKVEYPKPKKS